MGILTNCATFSNTSRGGLTTFDTDTFVYRDIDHGFVQLDTVSVHEIDYPLVKRGSEGQVDTVVAIMPVMNNLWFRKGENMDK